MVETILSSPFFIEIVLPFLLVFTLIFAILDRGKIFGEGKKQINAIIAFVVGLIFVSFSKGVGITVNLMGVMSVVAVILLVFIILFSFVSSDKEFKMPNGLTIAFGILIGLIIIISLLVFTGYWDEIVLAFSGQGKGSTIAANVGFIVIIIAAVAIVLWGSKKKE